MVADKVKPLFIMDESALKNASAAACFSIAAVNTAAQKTIAQMRTCQFIN